MKVLILLALGLGTQLSYCQDGNTKIASSVSITSQIRSDRHGVELFDPKTGHSISEVRTGNTAGKHNQRRTLHTPKHFVSAKECLSITDKDLEFLVADALDIYGRLNVLSELGKRRQSIRTRKDKVNPSDAVSTVVLSVPETGSFLLKVTTTSAGSEFGVDRNNGWTRVYCNESLASSSSPEQGVPSGINRAMDWHIDFRNQMKRIMRKHQDRMRFRRKLWHHFESFWGSESGNQGRNVHTPDNSPDTFSSVNSPFSTLQADTSITRQDLDPIDPSVGAASHLSSAHEKPQNSNAVATSHSSSNHVDLPGLSAMRASHSFASANPQTGEVSADFQTSHGFADSDGSKTIITNHGASTAVDSHSSRRQTGAQSVDSPTSVVHLETSRSLADSGGSNKITAKRGISAEVDSHSSRRQTGAHSVDGPKSFTLKTESSKVTLGDQTVMERGQALAVVDGHTIFDVDTHTTNAQTDQPSPAIVDSQVGTQSSSSHVDGQTVIQSHQVKADPKRSIALVQTESFSAQADGKNALVESQSALVDGHIVQVNTQSSSTPVRSKPSHAKEENHINSHIVGVEQGSHRLHEDANGAVVETKRSSATLIH